jgi:hypothetical protein
MAKDLTTAVVRVGHGRGFVVEHHRHGRVVVTASHCLPVDSDDRLVLPPSHPGRYVHEETYQKLLGLLSSEPTVWTRCLFVDPVADIAMLGSPDNQALSEEADAYEEFVGSAIPLKIGDAPEMGHERTPVRVINGHRIGGNKIASPGRGSGRLLSLEGAWLKCTVERRHNGLAVQEGELVESGMSGSPILSTSGKAMALMSMDGFCPVLTYCLPVWFFK